MMPATHFPNKLKFFYIDSKLFYTVNYLKNNPEYPKQYISQP